MSGYDYSEPAPGTVTCKRCGRVSFAMTRADAQAEVDSFNAAYENMPEEHRRLYGGPSSLASYTCLCGGTEFRPAVKGDCPDGCTIGPVICDGLAVPRDAITDA